MGMIINVHRIVVETGWDYLKHLFVDGMTILRCFLIEGDWPYTAYNKYIYIPTSALNINNSL